MAKLRQHTDLLVWQRAMELVVECYVLGRRLPNEERYGLRTQMQRAAVSIASNIAEGNGQRARGAYLHHVSIAIGSLREVQTYLTLIERLGYLRPADTRIATQLSKETSRMLVALLRALSKGRE